MRLQLPEETLSLAQDDGTHVLTVEPISDEVVYIHVGNDWNGLLQIYVDKPQCDIRVNDEEV